MGNSTVRLIDVLDYAQSFPELQAVLPVAGYSTKLVYMMANAIMSKMLSSQFKFPWNRGNGSFLTNAWQQDYPMNYFNVGFGQDATLLDINNTANPRPIWPLEWTQNLPRTNLQYGRPGQVCVLFNKDMWYATWGASTIGTGGPQINPQPGQTITMPIGLPSAPQNPNLQIRDPNGNLWILTTYGTLGVLQPSWPSDPVFPTYQDQTIAPTVVDDGTASWSAVNPNGQGFRVSPIPPMTGITYLAELVWQARAIPFRSMQQTIEPIPDDSAPFFWDGFVAKLWPKVPDPKVRAKHADAEGQWIQSLRDVKVQGDRNRDSAIMYPSDPIMGSAGSFIPNPAQPYGPAY